MDRTSRIAIFVCVVLLVGTELTLEKLYPPAPPKPPSAVTSTPLSPLSEAAPTTATPPVSPAPAMPPPAPVEEKLTLLENDAIKVTFTTAGAAIREVQLKQHKDAKTGNVVLNEQSHENILELGGWPGA